jgi:hypothetical protein
MGQAVRGANVVQASANRGLAAEYDVNQMQSEGDSTVQFREQSTIRTVDENKLLEIAMQYLGQILQLHSRLCLIF